MSRLVDDNRLSSGVEESVTLMRYSERFSAGTET